MPKSLVKTFTSNTGGGTDAYMVQQAGLGSPRPTLMYQDIPVFRNDFISKSEAVNSVDLTIDAVNSATSVDLSADPEATVGAGNAQHLLVRGADDGILYRYEIQSNTTGTVVVDASGSFFDPEQNLFIARRPLNDAGLIVTGTTVGKVAERLDGSSIYCGCFGELKGIVGFTSANNAGLKMEYVGPRENENAYQYRLKWYTGFDLYNRLSLARMDKVLGLD